MLKSWHSTWTAFGRLVRELTRVDHFWKGSQLTYCSRLPHLCYKSFEKLPWSAESACSCAACWLFQRCKLGCLRLNQQSSRSLDPGSSPLQFCMPALDHQNKKKRRSNCRPVRVLPTVQFLVLLPLWFPNQHFGLSDFTGNRIERTGWNRWIFHSGLSGVVSEALLASRTSRASWVNFRQSTSSHLLPWSFWVLFSTHFSKFPSRQHAEPFRNGQKVGLDS